MFYDANILFDLISGLVYRAAFNKTPDSSRVLNAEGVHNQAKKMGIPSCISLKTNDLLEKRVTDSANFVADIVRSLSAQIRKKKTDPSTGVLHPFNPEEDIFLIEERIFEEFRQLSRPKDWEKESLRSIERLIVENIRKNETGKELQTDKMIDNLSTILLELNEVSEARKQAFLVLNKQIQVLGIGPESGTIFNIERDAGVMDHEDALQLAVAAQHQKVNNVWTVFVSTDYRDIITARFDLYNTINLVCSQPLYAIDHLKRLNKTRARPDMSKAGYIR